MATYNTQASDTSVSEGGLLVTTVTTTDVQDGTILYYGIDTTVAGSISGADLATGTLMGQTTVRANTAEIRHQLAEDYVAGESEHIKINLYSDKPYGTLVHEGQFVTVAETSQVIEVETEIYTPEDTPFQILKWADPVTVPSLKLPEYVGNGAGPWALDPSLFPTGAPALYQDVDPAQELYGGIANEFFEYNISSENRNTPYYDSGDPVAWYSQYEVAGVQELVKRADGVDVSTPIYGYDGTYPGVTFKTKVGSPVVVRHYNQLPGYEGINPVDFPERESIHLHGGHNPSHSDGYSSYVVNPGMYRDYYYANTVPNREDGQPDFSEAPSTMWYHDHGEDLTDLHVILGMSGFWQSYDEYELGLVRDMKLPGWSNKDENGNLVEWDEQKFMQNNSKYDIALAISDRTFNADGSMFFDGSPVGDNIDGYLGDVQLVNGVAYPFLVVEPTQTRLRMLGASTGRYYHLSIQDEAGVKQDHLRIGNDTWLNGEAIQMDEFTLSMAQRADVVMDFSQYEPGTVLYLVNTGEQTSGRGPNSKLNDFGKDGKFSDRIMKIVVGEATPSTPTYNLQVGDALREHHKITPDEIVRTRQFEFGRRGGMWVINQQAWEHDRVDNAITLGNAEQWNLINGSGGWWHPIHIHLESHQVLTIEGQAPSPDYWPEKQWKSDTTILGANTTAEIAMKFRTFEGGFVFHCHNLNHEDSMMMYNFWTQLYDGFYQEGGIVKPEYHHAPDYFPLLHDPAHIPGAGDGPTNSIDAATGVDHSTSADIAVGTVPHGEAAAHVDANGATVHTGDAGHAAHDAHAGHLGADLVQPAGPVNLSADVMAAFGDMTFGSDEDEVLVPSGAANHWGDSYIHGGGGNDDIYGSYGNDVLVGGKGDDYLNGGAGMDMAIYGTTASELAFALVGEDLAVSTALDGKDILRDVEMLLAKDGMFHFAPGATDGDDNLGYAGKSRVLLFGGKGNDSMTGGGWDDIFYVNGEGSNSENAVNGRDFVDGNGWAESGDQVIFQGDATTETYRIYAIKASAENSINNSYRDTLVSVFGEFNQATEVVVLRAAADVSVDDEITSSNFQAIAEVTDVQEFFLKLGEADTLATTQKVQIFGDFDTTSVSKINGFVLQSESAVEVDLTNLVSVHAVTVQAPQFVESVIIGRRLQDKIVDPDCEDCEEHSSVTLDFNDADNGVGAKVYTNLASEQAVHVDGNLITALTDSLEDRILLPGKLDYDNNLDSDITDDNYKIEYDRDKLSIKGRSTGDLSFKNFEWITFADAQAASSLINHQHSAAHEEAAAAHVHDEECTDATCEEHTAEVAAHVHDEECTDCEEHTAEAAAHVHDEDCTDETCEEHVTEFYYKEFAKNQLDIGLSIVKEPVFSGDDSHELVIREFGNQAEHDAKFYLAVSAESLRDASITTLDFTVDLGSTFNDVFNLRDEDIHFSDNLDVQRRVEVTRDEDGNAKSIRFAGADLENKISSQQAVAYIALELRGDIESLIKAERSEDAYGFMNKENFSVPLTFSADANVDSVVWDDLYSLRDLGGQYAMLNPDLNVVARSAEAKLTAAGSFDLGTLRHIRKEGAGELTNLVRHGDTIMQSNTWQNDGEFTFVDLELTAISSDSVDVTVQFSNGDQYLSDLGWSSIVGEGSVTSVDTTFKVTGQAGQVIDTREAGYKLEAHGDYMWNTTEMDQFNSVKHLITYQGDLNYDGRVGMKDLAYLEAGMRSSSSTVPHDVDANFDNKIDILDLSIIDQDWNKSIHQGDQSFAGSNNISMAELFEQNGHSWDSSNFANQNQIESGLLHELSKGHERTFVDELSGDSGVSAAGLDDGVVALFEEQNQQYALTSV